MANTLLFRMDNEKNKEHIVQINRIEKEIEHIKLERLEIEQLESEKLNQEQKNEDQLNEEQINKDQLSHEQINKEVLDIQQIDLSKYSKILQVYPLSQTNQEEFYRNSDSDYIIREIEGELYRFDYNSQNIENRQGFMILLNISLIALSILLLLVVFLIRYYIIKPFNTIIDVPSQLANGNLSVPLKESGNKFFGRFIWGLDLLREDLEAKRKKELELQKEKKTLVLSLSHDINTPLSAIKLYAKALSKNLYDTKEKQLEIALNIDHKADEISSFVSEIINASSGDFLKLEVINDSFYLKEFIDKIQNYYLEKFDLLKIPYDISGFDNCILQGDFNRSIEVLQNIIENAIKYGSGEYLGFEIYTEENCIIICVKNSGSKLLVNELKYIFDSFWRGSNTENIQGSGLGLYIARQLMIKMNGDIFAKMNGSEMQVSVVLRKL